MVEKRVTMQLASLIILKAISEEELQRARSLGEDTLWINELRQTITTLDMEIRSRRQPVGEFFASPSQLKRGRKAHIST